MSSDVTEEKIHVNSSITDTPQNQNSSSIPILEKQVENQPKNESKQLQKVSIIQLFSFATSKERILIILAIILSITSGFLNPFSIVLYGSFFTGLTDPSIKDNLLHHLYPIILNITYTAIGILVSTYLSNQLWIRTGEYQAQRIRRLYLRAILNQDMSWFDQRKDDSLTTRLTDDTQVIQEGISEKVGLSITYFTQFATGLIIAFYKGYQMALILFSVVPIFLATVIACIIFVKKYMYMILSASSDTNSTAEQAFRSIRTVHTFSLQKRFIDVFSMKSDKLRALWLKKGFVVAMTPAVYMFFLFGFAGLSLWYGSRLVVAHELDASSLYVIFILIIMGSTAMSKMLMNISSIGTACGAAMKVFDVIRHAPSINTDTGETLKEVQGTIEFKNVSFTYPSRPDMPILKSISFHIKQGTTVAFVGASGSGKSTLIQLLQRFYDPDSGSITLDGHKLNTLNVRWLRQTLGIVGQQPVLFNATIRENLALGSDGNVTEAEMISACKEANCHQFIRQLPNGYDTLVGDSGAMLSGGQRQRIAIARAIIKNPSILLLDEATSALDTKSERLVQYALDNASATRTTIVVAHRLSTISKADKIFVVDNGRIIEQGTHQTLIAQNGPYAHLVNKQQIDMDDGQDIQDLVKEEIDDTASSFYDDKSSVHGQQHFRMMRVLTGSTDKSYFSQKIIPESKIPPAVKEISSWKIIKEMKPEWRMLALGVLGAVLQGATVPFYGYCFSSLIGTLGIDPHPTNKTGLVGVNLTSFLLFIGGIMGFLGHALGDYCFFASGQHFSHRLRVQVFSSYLKQEIAYFDAEENNVGILLSKLTVDTNKVSAMVSEVWGQVVYVVSCAVLGITFSYVHSWQITLIVLALVPLILFCAFSEIYIFKQFETKNKEAYHKSSKIASEVIREIRTVASLNKQGYFEQMYSDALEIPHKLTIKKSNVSSVGIALNRSVLVAARAIVFVTGAVFIMRGNIDFLQFFASMTILLVSVESMSDKIMVGSVIVQGKIAVSSIFDVIHRQPSIDVDLEGLEPSVVQGDVNLDRVQFAYPTRPERPVFKGKFKLSATAGQSVALVGASGCGKSTIIGLLLRWYDTQGGTVDVDHTDVKTYSLTYLRKHMAVVSQEPVLFDTTIKENVQFGSDVDVTQQEIEEACKAANIHAFIMGLPDGYETRVGDKGSQLSGGQRQRIAIARALVRKPKILLLDEATSALDSESEQLVQEALDRIISEGKRTTITIAHRLSTITHSDVICVVDKGQVVEQGSHQELLAQEGVYARLVFEQSLNNKN